MHNVGTITITYIVMMLCNYLKERYKFTKNLIELRDKISKSIMQLGRSFKESRFRNVLFSCFKVEM